MLDGQGNVLIGTNKGVFVSTDGLGGKQFVSTNLNYLQVNALAVDLVSKPPIVYAGLEGGITASNDDFTTNFSPGLSLAIFPKVYGLAVDNTVASGPAPVFAALEDFTNRSGWIVESTDGGSTFQMVLNGQILPGPAVSLAIDQTTTPPTLYSGVDESADATVTELSADGTEILVSTFLGGPEADVAEGIVLDGSDNAYVTGETYRAAFPVTTNAFEPSPVSTPALADAFVVKLPNSLPGAASVTAPGFGTTVTFR